MSKLNVGLNVDLGNLISELKKSGTKFKQNRTYNKKEYDELLGKYAESLDVIDQLEKALAEVEKSKLPSGEEIENMGKMFNMLGMMNENMPELLKLKKQIDELKDD